MARVTRDIELASAQDLLERAPRACLAHAGDGGPEAAPVTLAWRDGRYLVGVAAGAAPSPGQEAVLLVDEGVHFFDLRAVYVRGRVRAAAAPPGAPADRTWLELVPDKTTAWDYGTMRVVGDES